MHPVEAINMPTNVSINVTQAHNHLHITNDLQNPSHITACHESDCFSSKLLSLCGACPQISFSISSSKATRVITITYPSYFYHLFSQLPLHHDFHTTNYISFSRPIQLTSPSLHLQHRSTLPSPSKFMQAAHINHPLSQFFTNISPFPLRLPNFHVPTSTPRRSSCLPSYCKVKWLAPGCRVGPSNLFMAGANVRSTWRSL